MAASLSSSGFSRLVECQDPPELPSRYEYSRLDAEKDIRLITLLPGEYLDPIRITIFHASLIIPDQPSQPSAWWATASLQTTLPKGWEVFLTCDNTFLFREEATGKTSWTNPTPGVDLSRHPLPQQYPFAGFQPRYEALSYTWGLPQRTDSVLIDTPTETRCLGIGNNLATALRHLRFKYKPRILWNDAICINQEDFDERSKQVRRMADVYRMADRVVVWLGQESEDSKLACATILNLGSQVELSSDSNSILQSPGCTEPEWWRGEKSLPYTEQQWQSLCNLLERQWFSRLWIWQEVRVASHRAIVQCGTDQFGWCLFRRAIMCLQEKHYLPSKIQVRINNLSGFLGKIHASHVDLLLLFGRGRKCLDPRDKVYALLGIADPEFSRRIHPHYLSPKWEVYRDAVLAYIEQYRKLDLLKQCSILTWEQALPTWAPNWSMDSTHGSFGKNYYTSGRSSASTKLLSSNTLEVAGIECANISQITLLSRDEFWKMVDSSRLESQSKMAAEPKYIAGGLLKHAIILTLITNETSNRFPLSNYPSLDDLEEILLQKGSQFNFDNLPKKYLMRTINRTIGRVFFRTSEGYVGIGPNGIHPGDIVCVLLGCNLPIVLRPTTSGQFKVIGEAYVHGLCDAEAILGPLPESWEIKVFKDMNERYWQTFTDTSTDTSTGHDPRLGPLPAGWKGVQHEQFPHFVFPMFHCFRCETSYEETEFDPRLSPDALETCGVKITRFQLV